VSAAERSVELRLLHPESSRERLTIVLRAYLDASGKWQSGDAAIVVAGLAVGEKTYEQLKEQWDDFRDRYGIVVFHATEFWARERPYTEWSDEKHKKAREDIIAILVDCKPFGLAIGVDREIYADWQVKGSFPFYHEDPYYFCLDRCLQTLTRGLGEAPKDEGVLIYCDQEHEHHALGAQLGRWHTNKVRMGNHASFLGSHRVIELTYGSSFLRPLLQVADIFANGTYKIETNSAQPEQVEFMDTLKSKAHLTSIFFKTFDHIEIDMKYRGR
jgi:uncharacterized protein DUF3800